jgi:hypothetical protein
VDRPPPWRISRPFSTSEPGCEAGGKKKAGMSNERSDPEELLQTIEFNAYNIGIAKRMKSGSERSVHHICGSNKVCYDES